MEAKYLTTKEELAAWDRFVDHSAQGSVFAKTFYLDAVGQPYKIVALTDRSRLHAGIVLGRDSLCTCSNPLFAKYLGILFRPAEGSYANRLTKEKAFVDQLMPFISSCSTFSYTFHPNFTNWLPFYWHGYRQQTCYTYRITDMADVSVIESSMQSRARNDINRAINQGIRIDGSIEFDEFHEVNGKSYQRQGWKPPYTRRFLEQFCSALRERNCLDCFGARDRNGKLHAVCGVVYDTQTCYLILNGIDHRMPGCGANTLLLFEAIKHASKRARIFDFEGSMLAGIEKFYRSFGGTLTPYFDIWRPNLLTLFRRLAVRLYKKVAYGK